MVYSPWQVQRLRRSLNAYYRHAGSAFTDKISWRLIADLIAENTGVRIPDDSLRQFVKPANKKQGKNPRSPTDPPRLNAIKTFLIKAGYLSESELRYEGTPYFAALPLTEFFGIGGSQPGEPSLNLPALSGTYEANKEDIGAFEKIMLHIEANADGLIQVKETSSYMIPDLQLKAFTDERSTGRSDAGSSMDTAMANEELSEETTDELDEVAETEGWAVCHQQGLFLIFLKERAFGEVHIYIAMAADPKLDLSSEPKRLCLLRYEKSRFTSAISAGASRIQDEDLKQPALSSYKSNLLIFNNLLHKD